MHPFHVYLFSFNQHIRQGGWTTAGPRSAIGRAPDSQVRGPGFDTRSGNILSFLLVLFQEGCQLLATSAATLLLAEHVAIRLNCGGKKMRRNHSNNVNEKDEKSRPEDEALLILIILLLLLFERKVQSILF